jgi:hypothetical protein
MPAKRIALCIPSRGNPQQLVETLDLTLRPCVLPTTTAIVGLDEDDPTLAETQTLIDALSDKRIVISTAPREDAVGAVYNRCAAAVNADLYLNSADDGRILTPGWDAIIAREAEVFPDGIGMIGIGQLPFDSVLPALAATTRRLIDKMGYFIQDHTPFWWMDNWLYEIATMIGRSHYIPMDIGFAGPMRTRGLRDVTYWACFFDEMRVHRRSIAETILASPDFLVSPERRQELLDALDDVCALFKSSQSTHRDPAYAERFQVLSYDAPDDERYRRIKARSMTILQELEQQRARLAS